MLARTYWSIMARIRKPVIELDSLESQAWIVSSNTGYWILEIFPRVVAILFPKLG